MAEISTELSFLIAFSFMMCFFALLIALGTPSKYQFINTFDSIWLSAGILSIATTCTIGTSVPVIGGLACGGAVAIWGIAGVWNYIIVSDSSIKLIIFTPIAVGLIYIMSKLIRGGG